MRGKRGFTLIETVIALGILTVALVGAITLLIQVVNLAMNARNTTTANAYMQKRISDTAAILCTGCNPSTLSPTTSSALNASLGTLTTGVLIDNNGNEVDAVSGHPADKYQTVTSTLDESNTEYTGTIYIDRDFEQIDDDYGFNNVNFIKIISKVSWVYKGITYEKFTSQYIKKEDR